MASITSTSSVMAIVWPEEQRNLISPSARPPPTKFKHRPSAGARRCARDDNRRRSGEAVMINGGEAVASALYASRRALFRPSPKAGGSRAAASSSAVVNSDLAREH